MEHLDTISNSRRNFLVAAEVAANGMEAELFFRENGTVHSERQPFSPWMLLADPHELDDLSENFTLTPLDGGELLGTLAEFPSLEEFNAAAAMLKKNRKSPRMIVGDLTSQLLTSQELRFYRGMKFDDVRRLQFDIETITADGYEFPNAARPEDEIVIISVCDNHGFETVLSQRDCDEKQLLERFIAVVRERDPDIIEGHNICRFDLPYVEARCKRHKIVPALGRDGSAPKKRGSMFYAAERAVTYTRYDIYGRSVVDTCHLAQFYDVIHRTLESLNLKYLARHFNIASPERTYVDGDKITSTWRNAPETLLAYAMDDARECRGLSEILLPSYLFMSQLVPLKLQDCVLRGKATVIDSLLTANYIVRRASLPLPEPPRPFAGALTAAPVTGIFHTILHCDVRSLYPSIILAEDWRPSRDRLGEFTAILRKLREFRLAAKDSAKKAAAAAERDYFNALQSTFKILINSFYGYLGAAQSTFNDYQLAERITARGREILRSMLDYLTANGCTVLEADTDGVYFTPPETNAAPAVWLTGVQTVLPPGIEIEIDGSYVAMFCYKSKNYALLGADGEMEISGAALKSRGLEPFQRDFMAVIIDALLRGDDRPIRTKYTELYNAISGGLLPVAELAKTETLKDSAATYKRKMADGSGRRSAAYELAAQSGRDYLPGDQITYYVTGEKKNVPVAGNAKLLSDAPETPDYNRAYYLKKLDDLRDKFAGFISETIAAAGPDDLFSQGG
ncbi:MAG: DNA polymerase domain-containing protein [Victivallaceae bacterium]|nr:DNA polymerase domain-containing protein [Victivallaceae bacterium]